MALFIGMTATGTLAALLWHTAQQSDQHRFDMMTRLVFALFDNKVEKYEQVLAMIRDFFNYNPTPTQTEWGQELDRLKIHSHYSSLLEVGFAKYPASAEVEALPMDAGHSQMTNQVLHRMLSTENQNLKAFYARTWRPLNSYSVGLDIRKEVFHTIANSGYRRSFSVSRRARLGLASAPTNLFGFYMARAVYEPTLPVETPIGPNESTGCFLGVCK